MDERDSKVFTVKVTINQEKNVASMMEGAVKHKGIKVFSILAPAPLKGYIFLEADDVGAVEEAIQGIHNVRGILDGEVQLNEIEHFLEAKPTVTGIEKDDIIEIIGGAFKGEQAKVIRVDESKEELTVELLSAAVPIPITVKGDYVRMIKKR
ncbi:MAG: transcription elongation factor Spt5 [Euryarchaeota archaeon]|nr:transcription elongation factor Spt5 [Euryarchaeota archaeon]